MALNAYPKRLFNKCDKPYFYCWFRGKRRYLSTDPAEADRKIARLVAAAGGSPDRPVLLAELIELWGRAEGTAWSKGLIRCWARRHGGMLLDDITPAILRNYHDEIEHQSNATIRHKLRLARNVLLWARKRHWLTIDVPKAPSVQKPRRRARDVPADVIRETWANLPHHARLLFSFILASGARPSEARTLRWDEVDLDRRMIQKARHKLSWRGMTRTIYLNDQAVDVLKQSDTTAGLVFPSSRGEEYTKDGIYSILRRASNGRISPYQLRHTHAQNALDCETPIEVLSALLGHHNISTTQVYAEIRDQRARQAADSLKIASLPDIAPDAHPPKSPVKGRRRKSS